MDIEKIGLIAQKISFAFEDYYGEEEKKNMFIACFNRYLAPIDPSAALEPYDAIISLARKNPDEFSQMVDELIEKKLIDGD